MRIRLIEDGKATEVFPGSVLMPGRIREKAKNFTFHLGSADAAETDVEQVITTIKSAVADLDIYLRPRGGLSSSPRLSAMAAAPSGRRLTLKVAAYYPSLAILDSPEPLAKSRISMLSDAVRVASEKGACIFLAPEYFFNFYKDTYRPWSTEDFLFILKQVRTLSQAFPKTLLIPGTFIWANVEGKCMNTAYVLLGGEFVGSDDDERQRYDKAAIEYEKMHGPAELKNLWKSGGTPRYDFEFATLRCRLEICKDHGTDADPAPDLQLVTATGLTMVSEGDVHNGGWCLHVDGCGFALLQQRKTANRKQLPAPGPLHVFELEFNLPNRAQGAMENKTD